MKTISVTKEMWKLLHEYKRQGEFKNINELIKWIIEELESYQKKESEYIEEKYIPLEQTEYAKESLMNDEE